MAATLTRRSCLKALAASAAAPALAAATAPQAGPGYIDAHVHVWTADTARYPLANGFAKDAMNPPAFTPDDFLDKANPAGVNRANLIQMSYYGWDNRYMLDVIAQYPGTFVGTAMVDPFGVDPAAEMRRLAAQTCYAFRIQPAHTGQPPATWLQPEPMDRMFATAAEQRLALSVLGTIDCLAEVDRMCSKHPEAPVIIDHLGLLATGRTQPPKPEHVAMLTRLSRHRHVYVKIGAFYALGERTPPYLDLLPLIEAVVTAFTPARCMWESDSPFQITSHTYEDSVSLIRDHATFLSAADKAAILGGTAEAFFFRR